MTTTSVPLLITCEPEAVKPLEQVLTELDVRPQSSLRRNLDGVAATSWLVVAGMAVTQAPAVIQALTELLSRNRVRRIECAGVVIDNPRPEDVDRLLAALPSDEAADG